MFSKPLSLGCMMTCCQLVHWPTGMQSTRMKPISDSLDLDISSCWQKKLSLNSHCNDLYVSRRCSQDISAIICISNRNLFLADVQHTLFLRIDSIVTLIVTLTASATVLCACQSPDYTPSLGFP
ncbi:hypothetical protein TNCV_3939621 [Trichonephila clavipes]|uniref:Uncharacterized protein n=1 Tax=Trichonephila clavipes TaxID=2585209 RepID=A0A8X7B8E2_TRICX|nr:hypothetical protein TNCV_3939621 [Trichonephila clavipes]